MIETREHEQAIIGSMLAMGDTAVIDAIDSLSADNFTYPPARHIFEAVKFLYDTEGITPTDSDVYSYLATTPHKATQTEVTDMLRYATSNHQWHIDELSDAHRRRQIRTTALAYTQKVESNESSAYEYAEMMIDELQAAVNTHVSSYDHISDIARIVADTTRIRPSTKTGFYDLDDITSGLYPKEYVVVGARPSTGKTALMLNMAYNIAMQGIPVGIFSLEMASEAIVNRLVCGLSNVSMFAKLEGKLNDYQRSRITSVSTDVAKLPIFIDDRSAPTAQHIRATIRKWKRTYGVGIVFIDYITKIASSGDKASDNREREVSRISLQLKDTAKDMNITLVAMSQLSRLSESRADKRPMSSDLRDSGQIEQDADKILLLHKPGIGKTTMKGNDGSKYIEIIVAKNRNGRIGACELYYDAEAMTFKNITTPSQESDYEKYF